MNPALILMLMQQATAAARRATPRPRWRKTVGRTPRHDGVRKHTAELRDIRYGD